MRIRWRSKAKLYFPSENSFTIDIRKKTDAFQKKKLNNFKFDSIAPIISSFNIYLHEDRNDLAVKSNENK